MSARRRVLACLAIWQRAGITITRHGSRFELEGLEPPGWWPRWCKRHAATLAKILPDQDRPRRRRSVVPLEDLRPAWNDLGVGQRIASRDGARKLLPVDHLRALAEFADLG